MTDGIREIASTLWRNKLRTGLTSFSVFWGIFILIILLGMSKGMQNQMEYGFRDDAINSLWIYPGSTSKAHKGLPVGRNIEFTNEDYDLINRSLNGIEYLTCRYNLNGDFPVSYGKESGAFNIRTVHPDHQFVENTIITKGRFINDLDLQDYRKVAVLGAQVSSQLFGKKEAIGEYVKIKGILFKVVGLFKDEGAENENQKIYLPISTAQRVYNGQNTVHQIIMNTESEKLEDIKVVEANLLRMLSGRHRFAPDDKQAIWIRNNTERMQTVLNVFLGIKTFMMVIGLLTIIAGVVGVSNIMLISVKERTKEFGIRKAVGATPGSIVSTILQESLIVTLIAGLSGLFAGYGLLAIIAEFTADSEMMRNPGVDIKLVVTALSVLVVAGLIAGLFPARIAANIKPVKVLRED